MQTRKPDKYWGGSRRKKIPILVILVAIPVKIAIDCINAFFEEKEEVIKKEAA